MLEFILVVALLLILWPFIKGFVVFIIVAYIIYVLVTRNRSNRL